MSTPAVTFDLWYTLVYLDPPDQDRYMGRQVEIAVRALKGAESLPLEGPVRKAGQLRSGFLHELAKATEAASLGESVSCAEQFRRAAQAMGRVADQESYLSALGQLLAETPLRPVPGALDCLDALRTAGYRIGVVSNTVGEPGRAFRPVLQRLGFDPFVEAYVFSDELPWAKPNPEIFRRAMSLLDSAPDQTIHVGDGWSDIEGATRAGLRAGILFSGHPPYTPRYERLTRGRSGEAPRAEFRATSLAEVPKVVGRLFSKKGGRAAVTGT